LWQNACPSAIADALPVYNSGQVFLIPLALVPGYAAAGIMGTLEVLDLEAYVVPNPIVLNLSLQSYQAQPFKDYIRAPLEHFPSSSPCAHLVCHSLSLYKFI
jgi:hypothetical protein